MKEREKDTECSICGKAMFEMEINNPYPVIEDNEAVCCGNCNDQWVMPARQGFKISDKQKATFHINKNNRK